jgi:hypothetical protein
VLTQAMERVLTVGRHNEALSRVVAFATTGTRSWIFMLVREFPDAVIYGTGKIVENYHLFPIDIAEIIPVWHCLNQKPSNFFIREDCFLLSDVLSSVGYHLGYCRIKLLQRTATGPHISAVYEITPSVKDEAYVKIPAPNDENSFVIKLSLGSPRGTNEYEILESLSKEKCVAVDYVHMGIRCRSAAAVFESFDGIAGFSLPNHTDDKFGFSPELQKNALGFQRFTKDFYNVDLTKKEYSPTFKSELCWWNYATENSRKKDFTAVFMRVGFRIKQTEGITPTENDVLVAILEMLHECDVLHCDPRLPNIMRFRTPWKNPNTAKEVSTMQSNALVPVAADVKEVDISPDFLIRLIDFDLSVICKVGATKEMEVAEAGGQRTLLASLQHSVLGGPLAVFEKKADGKSYVLMQPKFDHAMLRATAKLIPTMAAPLKIKDPAERANVEMTMIERTTLADVSRVLFPVGEAKQLHGMNEDENPTNNAEGGAMEDA